MRTLHDSIPSLMSKWKVEEALEAAKEKLELMLTIEEQLTTVVPSALMEVYEMEILSKVKDLEEPFFQKYFFMIRHLVIVLKMM